MALGSNIVSHEGILIEDWSFPFLLPAAAVEADKNKAMAADPTVANGAIEAADGDMIIGQLRSFEDRKQEGVKIGAVMMKGGVKFTKTAAAIAVGDSIVGAGSGLVKKFVAPGAYSAATVYPHNVVTAVSGNEVEVILL